MMHLESLESTLEVEAALGGAWSNSYFSFVLSKLVLCILCALKHDLIFNYVYFGSPFLEFLHLILVQENITESEWCLSYHVSAEHATDFSAITDSCLADLVSMNDHGRRLHYYLVKHNIIWK